MCRRTINYSVCTECGRNKRSGDFYGPACQIAQYTTPISEAIRMDLCPLAKYNTRTQKNPAMPELVCDKCKQKCGLPRASLAQRACDMAVRLTVWTQNVRGMRNTAVPAHGNMSPRDAAENGDDDLSADYVFV